MPSQRPYKRGTETCRWCGLSSCNGIAYKGGVYHLACYQEKIRCELAETFWAMANTPTRAYHRRHEPDGD